MIKDVSSTKDIALTAHAYTDSTRTYKRTTAPNCISKDTWFYRCKTCHRSSQGDGNTYFEGDAGPHSTNWVVYGHGVTGAGVFNSNPSWDASLNINDYYVGKDLDKHKGYAVKWMNKLLSHFGCSGTGNWEASSRAFTTDNEACFYPWLKNTITTISADGKTKVKVTAQIHRKSNTNKEKLDKYNDYATWTEYKRHCNNCNRDW